MTSAFCSNYPEPQTFNMVVARGDFVKISSQCFTQLFSYWKFSKLFVMNFLQPIMVNVVADRLLDVIGNKDLD